VPEPDVVIVPVGGGGLISGIASTIKLLRPNTQVIGVEPTGAAVIVRSLQAGSPQRLDRPMSVADGLCAPFAGEHTFAHIRERVDQVVLVEDDAIMRALRSLIERAKLAPEPAGAASLAAIQSGAVRLRPKARVVCVVSGGNAEPAVLQRALS
jgi:threonine dehydratase